MLIRFVCIFFVFVFADFAVSQDVDVWIGTAGKSGIHHVSLNVLNGKLSVPRQVADIDAAGFVVLNQKRDKLYSTASESGRGQVVSFEIVHAEAGEVSLKKLNQQAIPFGQAAHINFDRKFKSLFTAQYSAGSICCFPVNTDGSIAAVSEHINHYGGSKVHAYRQDSPHPHWIGADPSNGIVAVPDLGLDRVVVYRFDESQSKLKRVANWPLAAGCGPRHMKFHPNGRNAYVLNELSLTVSVLERRGPVEKYAVVQTIASLPSELKDDRSNTAAEIRIHPNGKFLYTSNRGHDSISLFSIDADSGQLSFIQTEPIRGSWPRNFDIDETGRWLAVAGKHSNTVSVFEIGENGKLEFTRSIIHVPAPTCIAFGK